MSIVAIISDTHFGARGDSIPLQNSMQKFFEKVFFPTLLQYGVKELYHAGDFTDRRKYVNYATAQWVYKNYREPLRKYDIMETVLVGNHDCFFKHSTAVNSINELYRDDTSVCVVSAPVSINLDGHELLCLPWICDENRDDSMQMIADSKAELVLAHLELNGFQMYRGVPQLEGLDPSLFDKFPLVMSGHYHHRSEKGPVHYIGAPYPMTWQDYRDERGFSLLDTQTHTLTFVENPYSIFQRIVYDDVDKTHSYISELCQSVIAPESPYRDAYVKVVVRNKTQPYWFDLFLDALYKINSADVMIVDDIIVNADGDEVPIENLAAIDTMALMTEYVDSLSISCSKDELNRYLRSLYLEAIAANASGRLA